MTEHIDVLHSLDLARRLATYAQQRGANDVAFYHRVPSSHIGAALADCVLQAGLNYRTVVQPRVKRIVDRFPETATLKGILVIIERGATPDLLSWSHSEKIDRFIKLVRTLDNFSVKDTQQLRAWLQQQECRDELLRIRGIGPKTIDYLCSLIGIDCVPIDRHIRVFARCAGVPVQDYNRLKTVVSCAADLLGVSRRDFDAWIWHFETRKALPRTEMN